MKRSAGKRRPGKAERAAEVDAYLAAVPEEVRGVLSDLRRAIKEAAPNAEELIWYRIPTYRYHGPLVHFMAGKNHCSLITVSERTLGSFREELKGYTVSGTTIHFSAEKPIPVAVVRKIVKARMRENAEGKGVR